MTQPERATDPRDVRFSYEALNPREDRAAESELFRDSEGIFSENGRREYPGRLLGCSYKHSDIGDQMPATVVAGGLDPDEARNKAAESVGNRNSPRYFEEMLRNRYGDPEIILRHLIVGCNKGNGYPYFVMGITKPGLEAAAQAVELAEIEAKRAAFAAQPWPKRLLQKILGHEQAQ